MQRKAVRFIFNKYRTSDSPSELMLEAGIPSLRNRAELARQKMLFQLFHNMLRIDRNKYLFYPKTSPSRHKHPQFLQEYRYKTDCFKFSFLPQAIRVWNSLPTHITTCKNENNFLSLLEKHLSVSQYSIVCVILTLPFLLCVMTLFSSFNDVCTHYMVFSFLFFF